MQKNIEEICAVIMTGGKSSRMGGGIKSLKKFNNKMIFDRIYEILNNQIRNIIINTNTEEKYFEKYKKIIIKDKIIGYLGPLAGIHASLSWINKNMPKVNWLISIPGDTPFIPNDLIIAILFSKLPILYPLVKLTQKVLLPVCPIANAR